jgi:indolepyruvate ferredoxin oxidoreductase beta subunit
MKPRVAEIAGTMPAGLGLWVLRSPRVCHWLSRWTDGKQVRTSTVSGFLLLHTLGGMKRWPTKREQRSLASYLNS